MSKQQHSNTHNKSHRPESKFIRFTKDEIEQSIPSRFEHQVCQWTDKIAVKTRHHQLTYRELNCFANRVAHLLLSRGGSTQQRVALLFEQSASLLASILGILKAGHIYVPMNPSEPMARTSMVLDEAGIETILTDNKNHTLSQSLMQKGRSVINVETLGTQFPDSNPPLAVSPDAFAYIFYTSGSTGKPKGVVDIHRNILHNIMRYTNNLHISGNDNLTLLQSASFSGSVSSMFCALLNGATVFPYNTGTEGLGSALATWLNEEEITIYHSVPAIFRSFLHGDSFFPFVRIVRLEGDASSKLDVELYKRHFPTDCVLVNGLGATETGITRQYFITHTTQLHGTIVPIGYPVENMDVVLVDNAGKEIGTDAIGEIAVRSKYLAVGYWNNAALTTQAFNEECDGVRLYRTGDMGLMRSDGCLEYFGRKDYQLKIKGHRVEAAEVESALLAIDAVKECVVSTTIDGAGEPQLVAYIVARNIPPPSGRFLKQALSATLPEYSIPSRYVVMDALPLNANLKVDRRLLPVPDTIARDSEIPFVPARTEEEAALVDIWERTLGVRPIGVMDNFFDIGGDSLATVRMLIHVEQRFGKELTPGTILHSPTIEQLAEILHIGLPPTCLVAIKSGGSKPALFCVPAHDGNVLVYTSLARHLGNDRPIYGLQPPGLSSHEEPLSTIGEMANLYVAELRKAQTDGPYHIAGFCFGGLVALEMAHQLSARGAQVGSLTLFDMNPDELPSMVTPKELDDYIRFQKERRRDHRKKSLEDERLSYIAASAARWLRIALKRYVWQVAFKWRSIRERRIPRMLWDVGLSNDHAFQAYTPRPFTGKLTLFLAEKTTRAYTANPRQTWKNLATDLVEVYTVSGEEGGMLKEPHVEVLAAKLRNSLDCSP